ncbi:MAG: DUF3089 domain-containing protein [Actinobacteria bacterium]|nr:DUF3089 domain-containing protein [Actinomycetota bacterium]
MIPSPTRSGRRVLTVLVAAALVVTACSSSDDESSGPTTTADAAATTTAPGAVGEGTLARYADYETVSYDDPAHWVCRPDIADDICDGDLDATVVEADGSTSVETFEADPDAPIDCFYVYPTISQDQTTYSDWDFSADQEGFVTLQQAARLGSVCRVFAPVYRQRTLTALVGNMTGGGTEVVGPDVDPFADVLDAFRTYMAEDNDGRGFVLIGHSQGTGMLNRLIQEEIDPDEDVRALLVGAYLAGGAVAVPEGATVGGDFAHVPICTDDAEAGCVTTWATFASDSPPPDGTFFGKVRGGDGSTVAACANPAGIGEGAVPLHVYLPSERGRSILSPPEESGATTWLADGTGEVDTPFVTLPGLVEGECTTDANGVNYLEATVTPADGDRRVTDLGGRLSPEWGLHLIDVNLVMGDIVDRVADQTRTWAG